MSETLLKVSEEVLPSSVLSVSNGGEIAIALPLGAPTGTEDLVGKTYLVSNYSDFTAAFDARHVIKDGATAETLAEIVNNVYLYAGYLLRTGCELIVVPYVYEPQRIETPSVANLTAAIALLNNKEIEFSLLLGYTQEDADDAIKISTRFKDLLANRQDVTLVATAADTYITDSSGIIKTGTSGTKIDTYESFANNGTYINDSIIGENVNTLVPNCVVYAELLAKVHQAGECYLPPAGFAHGELSDVVDLTKDMSLDDVHKIQKAGFNPIVNKSSIGNILWGNNTFAAADPTANAKEVMDLHVRLLTNWFKRRVYSLSQQFMFELDNEATWNQWKNVVEPVIRDVFKIGGLRDYSVKMDATTMSADDINSGILRGKIMFWPVKAVTKIYITFTIDKDGVNFQ